MVAAKKKTRAAGAASKTPKASTKPKAVVKPKTPETDWMLVGQRYENDKPDAAPETLMQHSERLARRVLARKAALAKGKITAGDAAQLQALAKSLRSAETTWRNFWIGNRRSPVGKARVVALKGHSDLFSALRVFVKDQETQDTLTDIGRAENDADLQQDLDRLVALGRKHAALLEGTDVDAARVEQIAAAAEQFGTALAGVTELQEGAASDDEKAKVLRDNAAERTVEGKRLLRERNRFFWALAELNRQTVERAGHVLRDDEGARGEFSAYTGATPSRAKAGAKAAPAPPPAPAPTPAKDEPAKGEPAKK